MDKKKQSRTTARRESREKKRPTKEDRTEMNPGRDQSRGGARQTGRLVRWLPGGAPRWPMLARRAWKQDRASRLLSERGRSEDSRGVWKKHGGLAPREDLPKTGRVYSSRQDCRGDIFDQVLLLVLGNSPHFRTCRPMPRLNFFSEFRTAFWFWIWFLLLCIMLHLG